VAWAAFGFFGIHTAFLDERVSEAQPFSVSADPVVEPEVMGAKIEAGTDEAAQVPAVVVAAPTATPVATTTPEVRAIASGTIVSHAHAGSGTAVVISDGTETFLRFEDDFSIDNGPDLNVYLVRGASATGDTGLFDDDFIDLGDLKGNIGAQNYKLPMGLDIAEYDTVAIWCVRFGVAFNAVGLEVA
jgi:hypothetical protein